MGSDMYLLYNFLKIILMINYEMNFFIILSTNKKKITYKICQELHKHKATQQYDRPKIYNDGISRLK